MSVQPIDGVVPIAVMPFDSNGAVDFNGLQSQIEFMIAQKIKWVGFGYGSEVYTLGDAELLEVLRRAVKASQGVINIVGNLEMTSSFAATEKLLNLKETGVEMVMVRPHGMWAQANQSHLIETLLELDKEVGVRMIYQDAPQNTGVQVSADSLLSLVDSSSHIKSLKIEPPAPSLKVLEVSKRAKGKKPQDLAIIGGLGGIEIIEEIKNGSIGTMPGPAFPEIFRSIIELIQKGDEIRARKFFNRILPLLLFSNRDMATFLFVQKYILVKRKVLTGTSLRMPSSDLRAGTQEELEFLLKVIEFDSILEECK